MGASVSKSTKPEPLNIEQLLHARARLQSRKRLTEELTACFNLALSEFSQEPLCVQENARMTIQSGPTVLFFRSGAGENEISVFHLNGEVKYMVKTPRWDVSVARVFRRDIVKTVAEIPNYIPPGLTLENMKKMVKSYLD